MKRVSYAEDRFLTDDRVADALLSYARTLAVVDQADVVSVPGVDSDGAVRTFDLLIGPASQISAHSTDDPDTAMDVDAVLADLTARQERRLPDPLGPAAEG